MHNSFLSSSSPFLLCRLCGAIKAQGVNITFMRYIIYTVANVVYSLPVIKVHIKVPPHMHTHTQMMM